MKKYLSFLGLILFFCGLSVSSSGLTAETASKEAVCDVVVVGGGSAGVPAAIQSARAGAKTILMESGSQLGGTATSGGVNFPGLFHAWGRQVIDGIGWEWVKETVQMSNGTMPDFSVPTGRWHWKHQIRVDIPMYITIGEELCLKAGVKLRYFEAPMKVEPFESKETTGEKAGCHWRLTSAAQGEKRIIYCRQLVDCTGNGTVSALAGAERMRESTTQPGTFNYTIQTNIDLKKIDRADVEKRFKEAIEKGELKKSDAFGGIMRYLANSTSNYVYNADNSTAVLRTETNIRGRQSMLRMLRFVRSLPGGEKARLISMSPETGVRETWRVKGEYIITVDDYTSGKVWDDSVAYAFYPVDLHDNAKGVAPAHLKEGTVATIPLRAMRPAGIDNLLVAGRCLSSDRLANSALRVQATCMSGGQAAGAAAALAAKSNQPLSKTDISALKALLKKHNAIIPSKPATK